jgi:hypothetical protein
MAAAESRQIIAALHGLRITVGLSCSELARGHQEHAEEAEVQGGRDPHIGPVEVKTKRSE